MKQRFKVTGMTCAACSAGIQKTVGKMKGVHSAQVSLMGESMEVDFDEAAVTAEQIIGAVEGLGYGASIDDGLAMPECRASAEKSSAPDMTKSLKLRFLTSLCFLVPLLYFTMGHMFGAPLPWFWEEPVNFALVQLVFTTPVLFINFAFFKSGIKAAIKRVPNMDTLVSLGSAASYLYSLVVMFIIGVSDGERAMDLAMNNLFFESAAMILTLVTLGKWLESRSKKKTGEEVEKLLKLAPETVTVERDGEQVLIPMREMRVGDIVVVKQGDSIPADGQIVFGSSFIDKSAITGESLPVEIGVGDFVTSATVNRGNIIKVRAEKVGEDTVLSKIVKLVKNAGASKAPIEKTVDKIAAVFVPIVLAIALVTLIVWIIVGAVGGDVQISRALNIAISVLVISCPCALGLATPVAVMAATGRGASMGILFKDAETLQKACGIKNVLLDKTATLTEGKPRVTDVVPFGGYAREEILSLAGGLELNSNHPLAECIVEQARAEKIEFMQVSDFSYKSGAGASAVCPSGICRIGNAKLMTENGIDISPCASVAEKLSSEGKTVLYLSVGDTVAAFIAVADTLKEGSRDAVAELIAAGIHPSMLTGDAAGAAKAIAAEVGISDVYSEVLPEDKLNIVIQNKKTGMTAMVGDGINDSPALKEADVGVAMGNGTDIAIDSADVVLVGGDLRALGSAVGLSKATVRNIHENLFWAFIYNVIGIPIAAGALYAVGITLNPMIGAAAMSLSSIFVVGNALRLMRFRPKHKAQISAENKIKGDERMKKILMIDGMSCGHCSARVENALNSIEGVHATVELKKKRAVVETEVADDVLIKAVENAGYKVVKIKE
ncbi:MAG TPA: heavy metal translocating P-type ATPase [Candidatus Borkfalkia excrementigallinarum]|uniref:Copper-exporting P-type ATPase n=1 Tax=Candidatus Borkfalkia excrementigallinarum TaxID=2838506 RepID=A0A9D2CSX5_9FIRM|nr:heavy metal translocating P-type ATPase [Candidatus Borkfalkia excrementigallinarum]